MSDSDVDTPQDNASYFGHKTIVEALLQAVASNNVVNNDGKWLKYLADANGKVEVVQVLA